MDIKDMYALYREHPVITTDSRDCPQGSIFVALKGETFDGNKFAESALNKGCAYAVIDNPEYKTDDRCLLVDDALQTFKDLAREHRRQFRIPVIGITGTNGKTTTKELLAAVLSERFSVMCTQGNFNNDVGVPKTLFRLNAGHEIAVVEMGASHPGDIKTLAETAEPTCGLITNVGRAHLQGFGSFSGVKRTKGELYDFLIANRQAATESHLPLFVNADNEHLMAMATERGATNIVKYGCLSAERLAVRGRVIDCSPFLRFSWHAEGGEEHVVSTNLIGSYNIDNMLAAATVGLHFGVTEEQVCHALEHYTPTNNRSQMTVTPHNHLIMDAYNANPSSMRAAISNLCDMNVPAKMAILGDMRELGDASGEEHQRIADMLREKGLAEVWLVGEEFGKTDCRFRKFRDVEAVKAEIAHSRPEGRYILVKGSNGIRLFTLAELL
ncbi:MAG: UDP-N-acetylmuramoyl-tripeptide--D-alanyl-D-alanine ligase [Prevotella sp.]|uniref:UDP-N-acetylmuramoyl-tripeptide--D-alanyl-D- alanine ligase n=1 Tax=Prevotella sp. TaxID=59823 RepID=UPI002A2F58D7|nr:UDP-N-acetylmuramoyl-tripeptide--D-alanyl-D-alanine ligase [Prevotella sp.]MDD7317240.1 UDP-N-acetylmuramoyl-tripeptide--D-alanyl-D-alanine ligase [Prevotellaceae bacterium]MDY4019844.1 UDP-N-acetylmuramoyl-tripeptide--D-alanyl-D-alanine ligase [Prevotella sp.]